MVVHAAALPTQRTDNTNFSRPTGVLRRLHTRDASESIAGGSTPLSPWTLTVLTGKESFIQALHVGIQIVINGDRLVDPSTTVELP